MGYLGLVEFRWAELKLGYGVREEGMVVGGGRVYFAALVVGFLLVDFSLPCKTISFLLYT